MTLDGIISIVLAVAIPGLMALIGGVLAARTLPPKEGRRNPEVYLWSGGFVLLFLASIVLAFVQQVRTTTQQQAIANAENQKELRAEGETKYEQGQLESINTVLTALVSSKGGGDDYKNMLRALLALTTLKPASAATNASGGLPATIAPPQTLASQSSVYNEVAKAAMQLQNVEQGWNYTCFHVLTDAARSYGRAHPNEPTPIPLPSDVRVSIAEKLRTADNTTTEAFREALPQIAHAHMDAIARMRSPSPGEHPLSIDEISDDAQKYEAAVKSASTQPTMKELEDNKVDQNRFQPLLKYLRALDEQLGKYSE